ncbi:hypothetical protein MKX03_020513, partial [Papaver bracteatum]
MRHHQQLRQPSLSSPYQGSGFVGHLNAQYLAAWDCRNLVMLNHRFQPIQVSAFRHMSGQGRQTH